MLWNRWSVTYCVNSKSVFNDKCIFLCRFKIWVGVVIYSRPCKRSLSLSWTVMWLGPRELLYIKSSVTSEEMEIRIKYWLKTSTQVQYNKWVLNGCAPWYAKNGIRTVRKGHFENVCFANGKSENVLVRKCTSSKKCVSKI